MHKKSFFAGIIGNLFDHYDNALFGLLAPFIAPLFFPENSHLTALILTYGMLVLGIISRPIGAFVFGFIGDHFGRKSALSFSLFGMANVTVLIGLLPTYNQIGILAPVILALFKMLQSFFAAGETTGGAILVLEQTEEKNKSFFSSLFDCSSVIGIFLASFVVSWLSFHDIERLWRVPFFTGAICALVGTVIRLFIDETLPEKKEKRSLLQHTKTIWQHRSLFLPIFFASGFTYATYTYSFTLMNGYLPFVSNVTRQESATANTALLLLDLLLLPFFGLMAKRFTKERVMFICAWSTFIFAAPLFLLLKDASLPMTIFVRSVFITFGVGFAATFHHFAQEGVPQHLRYSIVALATVLGSQIIGRPAATISLLLYQKTGIVSSPAVYLMIVSSLAGIFISSKERKLRGIS